MLVLHLVILGLTVAVILYTDHLGFQYFRGLKQTLDARQVRTLHYLVWFGLVSMIATGLWMAWPALGVLLTTPLFLTKMGFVAVLVINAVFIGFFLSTAIQTPYASLTPRQKAPLLISGALSSISWLGAILSAVFLFGNVFAWLGF